MINQAIELGPPRWYALRTRLRWEKAVYAQLANNHVEAFLPTVTRCNRWSDRAKKVILPLFPGYCFASFDHAGRRSALQCAGVYGVVSFAGMAAPVADAEIDAIRRVVASRLAYDPCPLLTAGDHVKVINGPLCGIIGRLDSKDIRHAAVVLSIELIGQAVRVVVSVDDIAAIPLCGSRETDPGHV